MPLAVFTGETRMDFTITQHSATGTLLRQRCPLCLHPHRIQPWPSLRPFVTNPAPTPPLTNPPFSTNPILLFSLQRKIPFLLLWRIPNNPSAVSVSSPVSVPVSLPVALTSPPAPLSFRMAVLCQDSRSLLIIASPPWMSRPTSTGDAF